MVIEAIVGEDHSVHVGGLPYAPGTSIRLVIDPALKADPELEEREAFVARYFGIIKDDSFEVPSSSPSRPIEPIL